MEKVKLSIEAIDEEIELSSNLINQLQVELDDLMEKTKMLTNRIKVMQAVDERFELAPKINQKTNIIKHYKTILECLIELKKEAQEIE